MLSEVDHEIVFITSGPSSSYCGVADVIPWPPFVNQKCYVQKCLS